MLPIGFYRPDLAETNPGVSLTVLNAIMRSDANGVSYAPQPNLGALATADALAEAPRGTVSVVTRAGQYQNFVGTGDKLFKVSASGEVTEIGSGYAVPSGDSWSFAQFGDYLYATNTFDGLVRYNIETGGTVDAVVGAPKGRYIFPLFNTLAMLDCDGNNRVMKTSKIGDPTVWAGDASNNYQEFAEGEELIAGCELGQQLAVVFQRNAIRVLSRTRDRSVFVESILAVSIGAQGADAVVPTRGWAYFVDTDGFHRTNGATVEAVGKDKVSRTFINSLASNALTSVQGAYDPSENRVLWRYRKSTTVSSTIFKDILALDLDKLEWVPIAMDTAALVTMASSGYTLDELDQFGTIDTLPYSLDSRAWKGGEPRLAGFNGDLKFGFVSGDALACTLETGAQLGALVQRLRWCTPVTDAGDCTVQVGYKNSASEDFTWSAAVSLTASGRAKMKGGRGKIFGLRFNEAAAGVWTFMRGFEAIEASTGGPKT
jgi:hypothetical protein